MDVQEDVGGFMRAIGQELPASPLLDPPAELLRFREDLLEEEFDETLTGLLSPAFWQGDTNARIAALAEVADGIADLIYVAMGTALALGIDMSEVWEEVHRTNMAKTTGPVRRDGKRLKPEGWHPPQIERIIREQVAEGDFADRSITG
jgi:predicted HAD superfamily Cof-like phosphohydrolase